MFCRLIIVKQRLTSLSLSLAVALLLSSCNFLGLLNYSSLQFGNGATSGSGATTIQDNDPSETESNLFADGPVDIPVSIAKLDSPDASKITVEIGSAVHSENAPSPYLSAETFTIAITGIEGCIRKPTETPKVKVYNLDTGDSTVGTVDATGRFNTSIPARLGANIMLTAVIEDESLASPYLRIVTDDVTQTSLIVTTNTNRLASGPIAVDDEGNYYLSLHYSDTDTNTFFKRNLNGNDVTIYLEHSDEQVLKLDLVTENQITYLNQYGEVQLLTPTVTSSDLTMALTDAKPAFDEVVSVKRTIAEYNTDIDTLQNVHLFMNSNEDGVIVSKPLIEGETAYIDYLRVSATNAIPLVRTSLYDDAMAAAGGTTMFVFAMPEGDTLYDLYTINLDTTNLSAAWSNRTTAIANLTALPVTFADASENNEVVFSLNDGGINRLFYWSSARGLIAMNDPALDGKDYAAPVIAPGGEYVIMCQLAQNASETNQLYVWRPGVDAAGVPQALTGSTAASVCDETGPYDIGTNNFIHLYYQETSMTPQHAIINANAHPLLRSLVTE